jgi:transcriptional regulator with XRE-family HTH domain
MLYIAENLKSFRKRKELTQEDIAEALGVSPQSVSKWERSDTYPDITLLPSLANLFQTSVDALLGMDKINEGNKRAEVFKTGHALVMRGEHLKAAEVLGEALKTFPNDESLMSELALALAQDSDPDNLRKSVSLCIRVLSGNPTEKVRHTTRAALCLIHMKAGDRDKAIAAARNLPHARESREAVMEQFERGITPAEIDAYLRLLAIGEEEKEEERNAV